MSQALAAIIASSAVLAPSFAPEPQASGQVPVRAEIVQSAGVKLVTPFVMPTVGVRSIASGASVRVRAARISASNATLTIHGEAGDAMSMAVPDSFTVKRNGGTEALTVEINSDAGDGLLSGDTMSVNVGGDLNLSGADDLVPGPYEGLLVLVVQYN